MSSLSEEAEFIKETSDTRPRLDIDPTTDPMFLKSDEVIADPESVLNLQGQDYSETPLITKHTCTKGYDLFQKKCYWKKIPVKKGTRTERKEWIVNISRQKMNWYEWVLFQPNRRLDRSWDPSNITATQDNLIKNFKRIFSGVDEATGTKVDMNLNAIVSVEYIQSHGFSVGLKSNEKDHRGVLIVGPKYLQMKVMTHEEIPIVELISENNCEDLESISDKGNCEYTSRQCIEGAGTRTIEGISLYSDCWLEEAIYQCRTQEEDKCKALLQKGCYQIDSKCVSYLEEGHCSRWEQTFECQEGGQKLNGVRLKGEKPFCLDGSCVNQSWTPNGDMIESLSKLAIFKEMQKDMDPDTSVVFKGKKLRCSRKPAGFMDCCKVSGWGKNIKLASCNENEQELAQLRKLNKCHLVGTYCAERKLGICTRKKTSYCCYNSKLAKLIIVQGKQQLNLSFGSPEHPQCEGLTLTQFTKIDFSKLDLSELFTEMFASLKSPNTTVINQGIQKSLSNKTYTITDKPNKITQGRQHGNF